MDKYSTHLSYNLQSKIKFESVDHSSSLEILHKPKIIKICIASLNFENLTYILCLIFLLVTIKLQCIQE